MAIFRRGRKDDPVDEVDEVGEPDGQDDDVEDETTDDDDEAYNRTRGPFDSSEVDDEVERINLGSLRITPVDGMQLRLELDQEQQTVQSAHALIGESSVQLQVFAAPRTLGVWGDIRTEIADSITAQGGKAEVVDGPLGRELRGDDPRPGSGRAQAEERRPLHGGRRAPLVPARRHQRAGRDRRRQGVPARRDRPQHGGRP